MGVLLEDGEKAGAGVDIDTCPVDRIVRTAENCLTGVFRSARRAGPDTRVATTPDARKASITAIDARIVLRILNSLSFRPTALILNVT